MEDIHLHTLLICNQQVLFHFHFHVLDAPALEKVIREIPKVTKWENLEDEIAVLLEGL